MAGSTISPLRCLRSGTPCRHPLPSNDAAGSGPSTLVREPGSWLSSYRRHISIHDSTEAIRRWKQPVDAGIDACAARPSQVVVLPFEDLVLRTDAVMRLLPPEWVSTSTQCCSSPR